MKPSPHKAFALLVIALVLTLACVCNPVRPAGPATTDTPAKSFPTRAPEPTKAPPQATRIPTATESIPTATVPPTIPPPLNRKDDLTVVQAVKDAMSSGSAGAFAQLVTQDIGYANYIEGGQSVTAAEFLRHLNERITSQPTCDHYGYDSGRLLVFTSGWSPPWQMTEFCYTECEPLDPPWESAIAGFFFNDDGTGWTLQTVWLNDSSIWKDVYQVEFTPCP